MRVTKSRPTAISVPAVFSLFVTIFKYIGTVLDGWICNRVYIRVSVRKSRYKLQKRWNQYGSMGFSVTQVFFVGYKRAAWWLSL